jgi:hypothetical protein
MNTTMEESEYRIQAPLIAQQMQVAVDAYKTMTQVDQSLKSKWLEYYKEYSSGHWVRCYKQCDFYTKPDALLPASNDTIGQLIAVVNEYFVALDIKPAPLESFKDLLPIDPKHYHYHKPEWGQAIDENGKPLVYGDGSPVKCTLCHRMGQFYAEYASKLKDLCIYYKDGSIANYYEEDGELVYLSDERKAQIRSDRRTIIDEYKSKWDEWMAQSPANVRPILAAALWNVAHSRTSTGAASLCFYLLSNEIVRNLSCPRTVSMKLVTGEPEFLGGNIPSDRLYQLHIGNQLDEFNNPRPVAMDGVNVGKIYPAPAKSSNSGNIKMNFSRLVIEGSVMASLRFIKDYLSKGSISMAEYEVVVILDSINAPVESAELAG